MDFKLPKYNAPNWQDEKIINSSDVKLSPAKGDGILPDGFYLTSIYPEYLKQIGRASCRERV